jgi:hypothetical protein
MLKHFGVASARMVDRMLQKMTEKEVIAVCKHKVETLLGPEQAAEFEE